MSEPEVIEATPVKAEIIPMPQVHVQSVNLFNERDPAKLLEKAQAHAKVLASVIEGQGLFTEIKGRRHVRIEGWTFLGTMLGVFPVTVWTREVREDDGAPRGYIARVEARTISGAVVGAAEAQCLYEEPNWTGKPDYAVQSMAQTRAASKALRLPLGFVVTLAGFAETPAEEMDSIVRDDKTWPGETKPEEPGLEQPLQESIRQAQAQHPNRHYNEQGTCKCGSPEKWKTVTRDGVAKGYWFCELADMANYDWKIKKGKKPTQKELWAKEQVDRLAAEGICLPDEHTKWKEKK